MIAGFSAGEHKISLTNAHMYYGRPIGEKRGDLNFDRPDAPEAPVAQEAGFTFPKNLLTAPTNHIKKHPYDQIILSWDPDAEGPCVTSAGVFDVFDNVYRDEDIENYVAWIQF